jgi:hypothetical protein
MDRNVACAINGKAGLRVIETLNLFFVLISNQQPP